MGAKMVEIQTQFSSKGIINLSPDLGTQVGTEVHTNHSTFPGGEKYAFISNYHELKTIRVNARCYNSSDLMDIVMTIAAINHNCDAEVELFIPYLPYARQDRICKPGEAFSLKTFAKILSTLSIKKILTYDVHSNVAEILIDNLVNLNNFGHARKFVQDCDLPNGRISLALICPDAGAAKKAQMLYYGLPHIFDKIVYCNKIRRNDGSISIDTIQSNIRDMDCVVVDDICDGGATFIELGKRLEEAFVGSASLFVSHGIFSKGVKDLRRYYDNIGTSNSVCTEKQMEDGIKVYNLLC